MSVPQDWTPPTAGALDSRPSREHVLAGLKATDEGDPELVQLLTPEGERRSDPRFDKAAERVKHEAEVNEIVAEWTRQHTKEEAMALISGAGVPAGAVFDSMELTNEPTFYERGILQTMQLGDWKMTMTTWPVRFDGAPAPVGAIS